MSTSEIFLIAVIVIYSALLLIAVAGTALTVPMVGIRLTALRACG